MTRRYRKDEGGVRRVVHAHPSYGIEGYMVSWTAPCSGCNDYEDGHHIAGPFGCHECGYQGKTVRREWIPFDCDEYLKAMEASDE